MASMSWPLPLSFWWTRSVYLFDLYLIYVVEVVDEEVLPLVLGIFFLALLDPLRHDLAGDDVEVPLDGLGVERGAVVVGAPGVELEGEDAPVLGDFPALGQIAHGVEVLVEAEKGSAHDLPVDLQGAADPGGG